MSFSTFFNSQQGTGWALRKALRSCDVLTFFPTSSEAGDAFGGTLQRVGAKPERFFSRKIACPEDASPAERPHHPFAASAFCAASCSASCFERPSPVAMRSLPMWAATTNSLSWSGPVWLTIS